MDGLRGAHQKIPRPMARPRRLACLGAVYHITSRGNPRQDIVADDRDRSLWLSLLSVNGIRILYLNM